MKQEDGKKAGAGMIKQPRDRKGRFTKKNPESMMRYFPIILVIVAFTFLSAYHVGCAVGYAYGLSENQPGIYQTGYDSGYDTGYELGIQYERLHTELAQNYTEIDIGYFGFSTFVDNRDPCHFVGLNASGWKISDMIFSPELCRGAS